MTIWMKVLLAGVIVGSLASAASLLAGLLLPSDELIYLSFAVSILGWVAAMVGLVGSLLNRSKAAGTTSD